jgi:LmbE family N-acetylglucosaminyl deacetylase
VAASIAARLAADPPDLVYGPLAVGGHADHRIVRRALESAVGRRGGPGLRYYEDLPYMLFAGAEEAIRGLVPHVEPMPDSAMRAKVRAALAYGSQVGLNWGDPDGLADGIWRWARTVGNGRPAERLWSA